MQPYKVTKTYGHERGLSCCFRQWRARSHCNHFHGYALAFSFEFVCKELDENGWVVDFGSLDWLASWLKQMFDHVMLVAEDDPLKDQLWALHEKAAARVHFVPRTGCEAFAKLVFDFAAHSLALKDPRVRVVSVTCAEHGANSVEYRGEVE